LTLSPRIARNFLERFTNQDLTFGFYRILELAVDSYQLIEEGAFYADDPADYEEASLESYIRDADHELKTFPSRFPLYPRDEFVRTVLYKWARRGAMIVGYNLVFDVSRLALPQVLQPCYFRKRSIAPYRLEHSFRLLRAPLRIHHRVGEDWLSSNKVSRVSC
jgi:hypothetical protein